MVLNSFYFLKEHAEIIELPYDHSQVCVRVNGDIAFVGVEMGKLKCYTCRFDTLKCHHVRHIKSATESESIYVPNVAYDIVARQGVNWKPTPFKLQEPLSKLPIPFRLPSQLAEKLSAGFRQCLEREDSFYILKPSEAKCNLCEAVLDIVEDPVAVPLFDRFSQLKCKGNDRSLRSVILQ